MRRRLAVMSAAGGMDVMKFYRRYTSGAGYLRLNRIIKRPYVDEMEDAAREAGMRFYVSDAHFKERCDNGSCCGLPPDWNYSRCQFTEAIVQARAKGSVRWSDIAWDGDHLGFRWGNANNYNTTTSEKRAKFLGFTMLDFMRWNWNNVNAASSPYKYFGGVLLPDSYDENGDVIYRYDGD